MVNLEDSIASNNSYSIQDFVQDGPKLPVLLSLMIFSDWFSTLRNPVSVEFSSLGNGNYWLFLELLTTCRKCPVLHSGHQRVLFTCPISGRRK